MRRLIKAYIKTEDKEQSIEFNKTSRLCLLDTSQSHFSPYQVFPIVEIILKILSGSETLACEEGRIELKIQDEKDIIEFVANFNDSLFLSEEVWLNEKLVYFLDSYNKTIYPGEKLEEYCKRKNTGYYLNTILKQKCKVSIPIFYQDSGCIYHIDEYLYKLITRKIVLLGKQRMSLSEKTIKFYSKLIPKLDLGIKSVQYRQDRFSYYDSIGFLEPEYSWCSGLKQLNNVLPYIINSVHKDCICIASCDVMTNIHPNLINALVYLYQKFPSRGQLITPWVHDFEYLKESGVINDNNLFNSRPKQPEGLVFE